MQGLCEHSVDGCGLSVVSVLAGTQGGGKWLHLEEHRHHRGVPVVGDKDHVLPRAERQNACSLNGGLSEHSEAARVVDVVCARLRPVKLGTGLAPHLRVGGA
jgi:hypothetical protein